MAAATPSHLVELMDWLQEIIEPVAGEKWQITLNSSGGVVEATARIEQSKREDDRRGITTTITRVTNAKFRMGRTLAHGRRNAFSTD